MRLAQNINIFDFTDYRKFLKCCYDENKRRGRGFTYRRFAALCDFSSKNYMQLIINGSRNLTLENMYRVVEALGLRKAEKEYFQSLVQWNQARDGLKETIYFNQVARLITKSKTISKQFKLHEKGLFSKWYYVIVREMVALRNFTADPTWIAKKLGNRISSADAANALQFLLEKDFIKKIGDKYVQTDVNIRSEDEVEIRQIRQFHAKMMSLAMEQLNGSEVSEREINGACIPLTKDGFRALKSHLKEILTELVEKNTSDEPDEIYQINFQFFKITKEK